MTDHRPHRKLSVHPNVVDIDEERRTRAKPIVITAVELDGRVVVTTLPPGSMVFPNFCSITTATLPPVEIKAQLAAQEEPPRRPWRLWARLGLAKRRRPS
jgi:hypothetical protein